MRRRRKHHNRRRGGIGLSAAVTLCLAASLLLFARAGGEQMVQDLISRLAGNGDFIARAVALELGLSPETAEVYAPRTAAAARSEDADDPVDELIDRYGEPPRTVNNLISVALLRAAAAQAEITDISQKNGQLVFTLGRFSLEQFSGLCGMEKYKNRLLLTPGDVPRFTFRLRKGEDPLRLAQALVADYGEAGAAP